MRTRGSIKRRPPSRRFRRSQSDCGDLGDYRAVEPSQENGARVENGDDVFPSKSKAPGSPPPNQEVMGDGVEGTLGSAEKPSRRSLCNNTEKPEESIRTPEEANAGEKAGQNPDTASQAGLEVPEPPQTCITEAEKGCKSQLDGTEAGEHTDAGTATEGTASEESLADEEEGFGQKSPAAETPEEGAVREKVPQSPEQKEGPPLEPGCSPGVDNSPAETSNEIQNTQEASTVGNSDGSYHGIMAGDVPIVACPVPPCLVLNQHSMQKQLPDPHLVLAA